MNDIACIRDGNIEAVKPDPFEINFFCIEDSYKSKHNNSQFEGAKHNIINPKGYDDMDE
jgi:hypothetical protein